MHSFVINAALVLSAGSSTVRTYPCRLSAPGTCVSRAGSGTQIIQFALDQDLAQAACYCWSRPRATGRASGPRDSSCEGSRLEPLLMGFGDGGEAMLLQACRTGETMGLRHEPRNL